MLKVQNFACGIKTDHKDKTKYLSYSFIDRSDIIQAHFKRAGNELNIFVNVHVQLTQL